ncbi:MAG: SOS response-associated peptidase [Fimbriimonas sp.]
MCIRYAVGTGRAIDYGRLIGAEIADEEWPQELDTFPGTEAPVVIVDGGANRKELVKAVWGLQPRWAKEPDFGTKSAYNARSETIAEKPAFREAFRRRRCVVPLDAFYEQSGGHWWKFSRRDGETMGVAGLYEEPNERATARTFTLVTTKPTDLALSVGHDRMLVILEKEEVEVWLSRDAHPDHLNALMTPCAEDLLVVEDAGSNKRKKPEGPSDQDALF